MKRILITSALPYVNNVPHLGNLIQVLSADVFARYCRLRDYQTLYICGTDEYGTATETRALEKGISPQELCDHYYRIHDDIYHWFNISFDRFGRTSTPKHTEITQYIFLKLEENGYITEKTIEQAYCARCRRFLADRYIRGTCPHCDYPEARGDQCESCGKLLDPTELVDSRCGVCGTAPIIRDSSHLYIDLPKLLPRLQQWLDKASAAGNWARNAVQMTKAWIRDGLHERAITRDLKWGIPVPRDGYREKVFYVWFDAPIGYISITANHTADWEQWWRHPEEVKLYQFIGKDNIPFHTVIFPSSLLGTGEEWTLLNHMSSTEFLNYESGKFSKSQGVGVFGSDAMETGIPADVWRFYIYYNRPERADSLFTWRDFQEKVNGELIGNLANLVNRTLTFVSRNFDGRIPESLPPPAGRAFWDRVRQVEAEIAALLERVELRDAFRKIFSLSSLGNKRFQDEEPWRTVKVDRPAAAALLKDLIYLIRDLAILIHPYLPDTASRIYRMLGLEEIRWDQLGRLDGIQGIERPELLFKRLEDPEIEGFRQKFAGEQGARTTEAAPSGPPKEGAGSTAADRFRARVALQVGKIVQVEKHSKADKLYIETVELGRETRTIVSGLVPYYTPKQLLGRNIIMVMNLKPARLRGVESQGMLLAAQDQDQVEVLFADQAQPGDRVILAGGPEAEASGKVVREIPEEITIEEFFDIPLQVKEFRVQVEGIPLECAEVPVTTKRIKDGKVQ